MNDPRLQAFIQSLILSVLIVIAFASFGSDAAPPPASGSSPDLEDRITRLETAVAELRYLLETRAAATSNPSATGSRVPRTAIKPEAMPAPSSLRRELDELRRMIRYGTPGASPQHHFQFDKVRQSGPTNMRAIEALSKKLRKDEEAGVSVASRGLLYATQDEILQRFGRPTSVGAGESTQERYMNYFNDRVELVFQFLNGHVVSIE